MEIRMKELNIITMQHQTDCEVAAIATALQISYDEAKKALDWHRLPNGLENPAFGNPWNLYRALIDLGYWKANKTLDQLLKGDYKPYKTIALLHDPKSPVMKQHWVVLGAKGRDHGDLEVFWGDSASPRRITEKMLKEYFLAGWPNCAFQPYKASAWRILWEKIKRFFGAKSG
jgi:hypothetical protein